MKENAKRRFLSVSAAVIALLSMQNGMITASAKEKELTNDPFKGSDWADVSCVPFAVGGEGNGVGNSPADTLTYAQIKQKVEAHSCNYAGGPDIDTDDVAQLESFINALYAGTGYQKNKKNAVPAGDMPVDIDGDELATPADYCMLMAYVQHGFKFTIDTGAMAATITDYTGTDKADLVVPTEVFYKGHIFPVMRIAEEAFKDHGELESVTFRDYKQPFWHSANDMNTLMRNRGKITASTYLRLGKDAFRGCNKLKKVYLPQNTILEDYSVFDGTPFIKTAHSIDQNGVCCLTDSDGTTKIAYAVTNSLKHRINYGGERLVLADGITALSTLLAKQLDPSALRGIEIPDSLNFIEDNAFQNFTALKTINNRSYAESTEDVQRLVKRYLSAFNNTQFIADITQTKIIEYANKVYAHPDYNGTQRSAVLALAKLIARDAEYSTFYSVTNDEKLKVQQVSGNFDLYLNDSYYINDLCRGSNNSASAVFLLGNDSTPAYTECEGFALACSLVLDQLGITNLFCGQIEHALNMVYIDGLWYKYDMSGISTWKEDDIKERDTTEGNIWIRGGIFDWEGSMPYNADIWVSGSRQFELYPASRGRQLTSCIYPIRIREQAPDENTALHPESLTLELCVEETAEQHAVFDRLRVTTAKPTFIPNDWNVYCGTWYYIDNDGDFLRNAVTPDHYLTDENGAYAGEAKDSAEQ